MYGEPVRRPTFQMFAWFSYAQILLFNNCSYSEMRNPRNFLFSVFCTFCSTSSLLLYIWMKFKWRRTWYMLPNTNSSNNEKTTCRSVNSERKNPRKTLYLLRIFRVSISQVLLLYSYLKYFLWGGGDLNFCQSPSLLSLIERTKSTIRI